MRTNIRGKAHGPTKVDTGTHADRRRANVDLPSEKPFLFSQITPEGDIVKGASLFTFDFSDWC